MTTKNKNYTKNILALNVPVNDGSHYQLKEYKIDLGRVKRTYVELFRWCGDKTWVSPGEKILTYDVDNCNITTDIEVSIFEYNVLLQYLKKCEHLDDPYIFMEITEL